MPGFMDITHQNGNGRVPDALSFTITDSVAETNKGFCETAIAVGSSVAGAINGVAGGIFSLFNLACA
jgi:hypothetical protein